jgi:hypothetical protein
VITLDSEKPRNWGFWGFMELGVESCGFGYIVVIDA